MSAARTAVGKAGRGSLRTVRTDEMAAVAIRAAMQRAGDLVPSEIDDVILGCAMPEAEQGFEAMGIGPLGCSGARLTVTLLNEMHRRNAPYGMVTMCIGGGMGAAGIFELSSF